VDKEKSPQPLRDNELEKVKISAESINRAISHLNFNHHTMKKNGIFIPSEKSWGESVTELLKQLRMTKIGQEQEDIEILLKNIRHHAEFIANYESGMLLEGAHKDSIVIALSSIEKLGSAFKKSSFPHKNLPYFSEFLILTSVVFNSAISNSVLSEEATEITNFYCDAERYLYSVTLSARAQRHADISMELTGPYKEIAYLFDRQTNSSLTEWVKLDSQTAEQLLDTQQELRTQAADVYINSLPLEQLYNALYEFIPAQQEDDVLPPYVNETEKKDHSPKVPALLLPEVINYFYPDYQKISSRDTIQDITKKLSSEVPLRYVSTFISKFANGKHLRYTMQATIGVVGSFLGPLASILFDMVWPKESLTMDKIIEEIKKQVGEGISDNVAYEMGRRMEIASNSQSMLEGAISAYDKNPTTDNKREVVYRTNSFYDDTAALQTFFFTPNPDLENYAIHYKTFNCCAVIISLRFSAITRYLAEFPNNGETINQYEKFLNESYGYLEKSFDSIWDRQGYRGIRGERTNHLLHRNKRFWIHDFVNGTELSPRYKPGECSYAQWISEQGSIPIDDRSRYFATEATGIRNICDLHTVITREFSRITGKNLPLADALYTKKMSSRILTMNSYWKSYKSVIDFEGEKGAPWYYLQKFGYNRLYNVSIDDSKVDFYSGARWLFSTGIGVVADFRKSASSYTELKFKLPYGIRCELMHKDGYQTMFLPVSREHIGKDNVINTEIWKGARFYFELEFYFSDSDGYHAIAHFTTEKGKSGKPVC
jgi:hypothetical protein